MEQSCNRIAEAMVAFIKEDEKTKRPLKLHFRSLDHSFVSHPSEWFAKHPRKKPSTSFSQPGPNDTLDSATDRILQAAYGTFKLQFEDIAIFLQLALVEDRIQLEEDWVSFGTIIGRAGECISPLSLLEICDHDASFFTLRLPALMGLIERLSIGSNRTCIDEIENAEQTKLALMHIISGLKLLDLESTITVCKEVEMAIMECGGTMGSIYNFFDNVKVDYHKNESMLKLFAAMDMFYHKFPGAKYAKSRVGTNMLRFQGCSVLQLFTERLKNVSAEDLRKWIFHLPLRQDLERLLVADQEILQEDSYMPYLLPMGLCKQSPYSAETNYSMYYFIHAIGCVSGNPCSVNAKMLSPTLCPKIVQNVMYVVHQFFLTKGKAEMTTSPSAPKHAQTKEILTSYQETGGQKTASASMPSPSVEDEIAMLMEKQTLSAVELFSWYKLWISYTKEIPDQARDVVVELWASIRNPPAGTIGNYLKSIAIGQQ